MAARVGNQRCGKGLDIAYNEVDTVAKMIHAAGYEHWQGIEMNPELRTKYEQEGIIKELIDTAQLRRYAKACFHTCRRCGYI